MAIRISLQLNIWCSNLVILDPSSMSRAMELTGSTGLLTLVCEVLICPVFDYFPSTCVCGVPTWDLRLSIFLKQRRGQEGREEPLGVSVIIKLDLWD